MTEDFLWGDKLLAAFLTSLGHFRPFFTPAWPVSAPPPAQIFQILPILQGSAQSNLCSSPQGSSVYLNSCNTGSLPLPPRTWSRIIVLMFPRCESGFPTQFLKAEDLFSIPMPGTILEVSRRLVLT